MLILKVLWGAILLLAFFYWALGGKFIFFTRVESGDMVFIFRGKTLFKVLLNVEGKKIEREETTGKWKIIIGDTIKSWINAKLGYYWIDWSPTANVRPILLKNKFDLIKQEDGEIQIKWRPDLNAPEKKSFLFLMPFKFSFGNLEGGPTNNAFRANIEATCQLEVVYPEQAFILLKGNCFEITHAILESAIQTEIADTAKYREYSDLRLSDKSENGVFAFMKEEEGEVNLALLQKVGFKLVGLNFTVSTTQAMANATEAEAIAIKNKEAAKQNADAAAMLTEAQLKALENSNASPMEKTALLISSVLAGIFANKK